MCLNVCTHTCTFMHTSVCARVRCECARSAPFVRDSLFLAQAFPPPLPHPGASTGAPCRGQAHVCHRTPVPRCSGRHLQALLRRAHQQVGAAHTPLGGAHRQLATHFRQWRRAANAAMPNGSACCSAVGPGAREQLSCVRVPPWPAPVACMLP